MFTEAGNLISHTTKRKSGTLVYNGSCSVPMKEVSGSKSARGKESNVNAAGPVQDDIWQLTLVSSVGGTPQEAVETYKLVCTTHTLSKASKCYSSPAIVTIRDVAVISKKILQCLRALYLKTFDVLIFTTNLITKQCSGNPVWTDRKKRVLTALTDLQATICCLGSIGPLEVSLQMGRGILCPNCDLPLQWLCCNSALDQWTLLVHLDLNSMKESI